MYTKKHGCKNIDKIKLTRYFLRTLYLITDVVFPTTTLHSKETVGKLRLVRVSAIIFPYPLSLEEYQKGYPPSLTGSTSLSAHLAIKVPSLGISFQHNYLSHEFNFKIVGFKFRQRKYKGVKVSKLFFLINKKICRNYVRTLIAIKSKLAV